MVAICCIHVEAHCYIYGWSFPTLIVDGYYIYGWYYIYG